jgi:hypothetical protein
MVRTLRIWCVCAAIVGGAGLTGRAEEHLRIVPLVADKQMVVSFELADAYTKDVRETITSGLRTTFTYTIELKMSVPAWVDRTIAATVVSTSDEYDNLTRRHRLLRSVDGRVVDALVTDDEAMVRKWLTTVSRVAVCPTSRLDPARDYYVRIDASGRPRGTSILGWATAVTGQARFTFVP